MIRRNNFLLKRVNTTHFIIDYVFRIGSGFVSEGKMKSVHRRCIIVRDSNNIKKIHQEQFKKSFYSRDVHTAADTPIKHCKVSTFFEFFLFYVFES